MLFIKENKGLKVCHMEHMLLSIYDQFVNITIQEIDCRIERIVQFIINKKTRK